MTETRETLTMTIDATDAHLVLAALYAYATDLGQKGLVYAAADFDRLAATVKAQVTA